MSDCACPCATHPEGGCACGCDCGDVENLRAALAAAERRAEEAEERAESWKETACREKNRLVTEANALSARVEALEGALSDAADDLTTWLDRDVDAFGPTSLRPHPCAPGQVRDRIRAALAAPAASPDETNSSKNGE